MPKATQSPSKKDEKVAVSEKKPPLFYTSRNLPPVRKAPSCPERVDVLDFGYNEKHELIIMKTGERCPQKDINACRPETLSEMAARAPGRNSLEKIYNLVQSGIIVPQSKDDKSPDYVDERDLPTDVLSAHQQIQKGLAAAKALPEDFAKDVSRSNLDALADALFKSGALDKYIKEKLSAAAPKETPKDE